MKNGILITWIAFITGFYTTFVLQIFWNWFVIPVLHVPTISFWEMYGLTLIMSLFVKQHKNELVDENRWVFLTAFLNACVPEDKKDNIMEFIDKKSKNTWGVVSVSVFERVWGDTEKLFFGWCIHSMLI